MSVDRFVHGFFLDHRSGPLTEFFKLATHLGSSAVLIPLLVVVGAVCWARRRSVLPLAVLTTTYVGALVLESGLKRLVGRARPPVGDRLVHVAGYAFPSGHATIGTAVWTMAGVLLVWAVRDGRLRAAGVVAIVSVVLLVDLSRVYLGVHWPSDVLAGSIVGVAWASVVVTTAKAVAGRDRLVAALRRP